MSEHSEGSAAVPNLFDPEGLTRADRDTLESVEKAICSISAPLKSLKCWNCRCETSWFMMDNVDETLGQTPVFCRPIPCAYIWMERNFNSTSSVSKQNHQKLSALTYEAKGTSPVAYDGSDAVFQAEDPSENSSGMENGNAILKEEVCTKPAVNLPDYHPSQAASVQKKVKIDKGADCEQNILLDSSTTTNETSSMVAHSEGLYRDLKFTTRREPDTETLCTTSSVSESFSSEESGSKSFSSESASESVSSESVSREGSAVVNVQEEPAMMPTFSPVFAEITITSSEGNQPTLDSNSQTMSGEQMSTDSGKKGEVSSKHGSSRRTRSPSITNLPVPKRRTVNKSLSNAVKLSSQAASSFDSRGESAPNSKPSVKSPHSGNIQALRSNFLVKTESEGYPGRYNLRNTSSRNRPWTSRTLDAGVCRSDGCIFAGPSLRIPPASQGLRNKVRHNPLEAGRGRSGSSKKNNRMSPYPGEGKLDQKDDGSEFKVDVAVTTTAEINLRRSTRARKVSTRLLSSGYEASVRCKERRT